MKKSPEIRKKKSRARVRKERAVPSLIKHETLEALMQDLLVIVSSYEFHSDQETIKQYQTKARLYYFKNQEKTSKFLMWASLLYHRFGFFLKSLSHLPKDDACIIRVLFVTEIKNAFIRFVRSNLMLTRLDLSRDLSFAIGSYFSSAIDYLSVTHLSLLEQFLKAFEQLLSLSPESGEIRPALSVLTLATNLVQFHISSRLSGFSSNVSQSLSPATEPHSATFFNDDRYFPCTDSMDLVRSYFEETSPPMHDFV